MSTIIGVRGEQGKVRVLRDVCMDLKDPILKC